jgi:hypothetical protein
MLQIEIGILLPENTSVAAAQWGPDESAGMLK